MSEANFSPAETLKWVQHATHMRFSTWVHVPLLQIPYQSHYDYYYKTHIVSHFIAKNVCHVLLTVIFNQRIIKAIHVPLIHCFWT